MRTGPLLACVCSSEESVLADNESEISEGLGSLYGQSFTALGPDWGVCFRGGAAKTWCGGWVGFN